MRIIKAILIFYKKLIVPALVLSVVAGFLGIGLTGKFSFETVGFSYIILGLLFHYFTYEVRNPNEYYFYYNIGLSKPMLWIATLVLNLIIGLTFILL